MPSGCRPRSSASRPGSQCQAASFSRCCRKRLSTSHRTCAATAAFVREGFRTELDEARRLRDDSRRVMAALEARYIEETGVKSLKIRHNNILGYFIEVTQANAKPLTEPPLLDTFRHRQSMANAMRFTTVELVETEGRIASAAERALAIEQDIFAELSAAIAAEERMLCRGLLGASPSWTTLRRWRSWPATRAMCAPPSTRASASISAAAAIRSSSKR